MCQVQSRNRTASAIFSQHVTSHNARIAVVVLRRGPSYSDEKEPEDEASYI